MAVSPHWRRRSGFFTPDGFEREAWLALNVHLALRDTAGAAWGRSLCVSVLRGVAMKRSLFAAFAVLALALLFVVPASAAPAGRPSHAAVSHVQVAHHPRRDHADQEGPHRSVGSLRAARIAWSSEAAAQRRDDGRRASHRAPGRSCGARPPINRARAAKKRRYGFPPAALFGSHCRSVRGSVPSVTLR